MSKFTDYASRYANARGITMEEALKHHIIKDMEDYYKDQEISEKPIVEAKTGREMKS